MFQSLVRAFRSEQEREVPHTCETNRETKSTFSNGLDEEFQAFRDFLKARRHGAQDIAEKSEDSREDESELGSKTAENLGRDQLASTWGSYDRRGITGIDSNAKGCVRNVSLTKAQSNEVLENLNDFVRDLKQKTSHFQDLSIRRRAERAAQGRRDDCGFQEDSDCPVCFDALVNPGTILTPCGHMLHMHCAMQSLQRRDDCPICRRPIERGSLVPVRNGIPRSSPTKKHTSKGSTAALSDQKGNDGAREASCLGTLDFGNRKPGSELDEELAATMNAIRRAIERGNSLVKLENAISLREKNVKRKLREMKASTAAFEKDIVASYQNLYETLERRKREIEERQRMIALNQERIQKEKAAAERETALLREERQKLEVETVKTIKAQDKAAKEKKNYLLKSKQLRQKEKSLKRSLEATGRASSTAAKRTRAAHYETSAHRSALSHGFALQGIPSFFETRDHANNTSEMPDTGAHETETANVVGEVDEAYRQSNKNDKQDKENESRKRQCVSFVQGPRVSSVAQKKHIVSDAPTLLCSRLLMSGPASSQSIQRSRSQSFRRLRANGSGGRSLPSLSDFADERPKRVGNRPQSALLFSASRQR